MALPKISFKEFASNPIVAMLFMCVLAIGYLYIDQKATLEKQITELQIEVRELKDDNRALNEKMIEVIQTVKK